MTLFATTFDPAGVVALVGLLGTLVLYLLVLGRERGYAKWFRQWEAERKARLDAQNGVTSTEKRERTGPWG